MACPSTADGLVIGLTIIMNLKTPRKILLFRDGRDSFIYSIRSYIKFCIRAIRYSVSFRSSDIWPDNILRIPCWISGIRVKFGIQSIPIKTPLNIFDFWKNMQQNQLLPNHPPSDGKLSRSCQRCDLKFLMCWASSKMKYCHLNRLNQQL